MTPFLWYENQAEEAANYYASIFKNSKVGKITRWGDVGPGKKGSVLTIEFTLDGQDFVGLNGGPEFKFTEAVSFPVDCKDQQEIDHYWDKLSAGGEQGPCGWLKDKYGLSWQVSPTILNEMLNDPNQAKANAAMKAMLDMKKIIIADLQRAYDGA